LRERRLTPVEEMPSVCPHGIVLAVGYYVRAFCTKREPSPLRAVLAYAAERGAHLAVDPPAKESSLDDNNWEQVGIAYKDHKVPILLEVNRDDGDESLMREEIEEFIELLEDAPKSRKRRRVEKHLRSTRFIVAAQLPTADLDEDGYAALGHVLTYFVNNNGAMIQADGEGFYEGYGTAPGLVDSWLVRILSLQKGCSCNQALHRRDVDGRSEARSPGCLNFQGSRSRKR
jgi:hypothetical protein